MKARNYSYLFQPRTYRRCFPSQKMKVLAMPIQDSKPTMTRRSRDQHKHTTKNDLKIRLWKILIIYAQDFIPSGSIAVQLTDLFRKIVALLTITFWPIAFDFAHLGMT